MFPIEKLFHPSSVAIIGASRRAGNVGNDIVKNLVQQGFLGDVYPINPQAQELYSRKCFPTVSDVPASIDLAIVVVPAQGVVAVVRECIEKGVRAIIVISAGFREIGNEQAEEEMRTLCDAHGVALLGPNCLGVINPEISMNASFASRMPKSGGVAFLSQSGALCTAMLDYAAGAHIGFSKFASIGNKAQIGEVELMRYLVEDPMTQMVALYIESLRDADGFIDAAQALRSAGKPVFVVKSGSTSAGASASSSHTGAIAGNDAVYDAVFLKAGVIRVRDFDDVFEMFTGVTPHKKMSGKRIAILTNAGGPGVLTTDEAVLRGLEVVPIAEATQKKLRDILPPASSVHNPIDILGDANADRYEQALTILLAEQEIDTVVIVLTPQSMTEIVETAQVIVKLSQETQISLYAVFMGSTDVEAGLRVLRQAKIATSRFPQKAIRVIAEMDRFWNYPAQEKEELGERYAETPKATEIIGRYQPGESLSASDAMDFFGAFGFDVTRSVTIHSAQEASLAITQVGGRAAFKIISPDIEHKSDVGGVALGVIPENGYAVYESMLARVLGHVPHARIEGVLVAEMIEDKGVEFIVGSVRDPNVGHAVMVGFGGIYVEVFRDVAFGAVPVSRSDALSMIERLKSKVLLRGARGGVALDEEVLIDAIVRFSHMLEVYPRIAEVDANPVLVLSKGARVLDARLRVD